MHLYIIYIDMVLIISCPHCNISIEIIELNCRIFRCGILKTTYQQIDPHLPKDQCDKLFETGEIYGCGKPFRVDVAPDGALLCQICEYI